jgi:cysteine desulfurase
MSSAAVYLDHHATTPVDPRVLDAMLPHLGPRFGNAGSRAHAYGWAASEAVETARAKLAGMLGASPREIVFTAGATESDNIAILGTAAVHGSGRIVTTAIEHHAVLDTCLSLRERGFDVVVLPVDGHGQVSARDVAEAMDERTILVCVMAANNEVGTIQPIAEIGRACRERSVVLLCDAAQAIGRLPVDVEAWSVDMLALSAHKFYGPQGVGALYVRARPRVRLLPVMHGGGQEHGLRPGTLNVPGIAGLGRAAELVTEGVEEESARIGALRDRLQARLLAIEGAHVNGHPTQRLTGNLSIRFDGVEAEALIAALPGLALSTGAACSTGDPKPSGVLLAMGLSAQQARQTLRFGLGRTTTQAEADRAADLVTQAVAQARVGSSARP